MKTMMVKLPTPLSTIRGFLYPLIRIYAEILTRISEARTASRTFAPAPASHAEHPTAISPDPKAKEMDF